MTTTGFADAYQTYLTEQDVQQDRERFDVEAAEIRAAASMVEPLSDPVATIYVADMVDHEEQGRVEWSGTEWRLPRRRPRLSHVPLTADQVLARFEKVRGSGTGWSARCPAHEDMHPSLRIDRGDRWWLLHCHVGCSYDAVAAAVGLSVAALALQEGRDE